MTSLLTRAIRGAIRAVTGRNSAGGRPTPPPMIFNPVFQKERPDGAPTGRSSRGNISAGTEMKENQPRATRGVVKRAYRRRYAGGSGRKARGEAAVRDALADSIPGAETEVMCSSGYVDVVTPDEIIEVKRAQLWKGGLGQVLAYSKDFPGLAPRLHLFGPRCFEHFALAHTTCACFGVSLTTEGGHVPPVVSGTVLPPR